MRYNYLMREKKMKDKETYARLTAPQHIVKNHFSEHKRIKGFHENQNAQGFMGSDRLLSLDTIYGRIQMGYSPQRRKSFIFANIKTSSFDTASSSFQKEMHENQMVRHFQTRNNVFSAKRRGASVVTLFKNEARPWSPRVVAPYLQRNSLEALKKTMPFLEQREDRVEKGRIKKQFKELQNDVRVGLLNKDYTKTAEARARQVELTERDNMLNAIIYRKKQQSLLFFSMVNISLDSQKHQIYTYYQERRKGSSPSHERIPPENKPDTDKEE